MDIRQLEARRLAILEEIRLIDAMRPGTVNEQFFHVRRQGAHELTRQGPYYVWTRSEGGKTVSQRLTSTEVVEQARADVAAYKLFQALCGEYIQVTSQLGMLKQTTASEKKRLKSGLNKTGK
ncbi:MAG: hypothetical protein Q8O91_09900 [Candidatus Aminicenantes bacterium]|nr:hypothetical protein [Candidatus Aminicenantes bacterium]